MAGSENVVDKLSIEINADAQKAVKSLDALKNSLSGLVSATRNMATASAQLSGLSKSLTVWND